MYDSRYCVDTVDGTKKSPQEGFWLFLVATASERYQDRWKWLLQASSTFLNPPGPSEKPKTCYIEAYLLYKNEGNLLRILLYPFEGSYRGGCFCTVYRIFPRQKLCLNPLFRSTPANSFTQGTNLRHRTC